MPVKALDSVSLDTSEDVFPVTDSEPSVEISPVVVAAGGTGLQVGISPASAEIDRKHDKVSAASILFIDVTPFEVKAIQRFLYRNVQQQCKSYCKKFANKLISTMQFTFSSRSLERLIKSNEDSGEAGHLGPSHQCKRIVSVRTRLGPERKRRV